MGLVDYGSDSEPEGLSQNNKRPPADVARIESAHPPPKKRKTLPGLPKTYGTGIGPKDDPALHQGRSRSRPYVDGDYDAHIYIALKVPKRLYETLNSLIESTRTRCPGVTLHSFLDPRTSDGKRRLLHISLAHPFPLRRSQIASFKVDLQRGVSTGSIAGDGQKHFKLGLAGRVNIYYNGRRYGGEGGGGRAFMALRVGAGAIEINRIVEDVIHPILRNLHRQLYHSNPEYHTSFAWCLVHPDDARNGSNASTGDEKMEQGEGDFGQDDQNLTSQSESCPIGGEVIAAINSEFEERLIATQPAGGWDVDSLVLKIGKDVTQVRLS